MAMADQSAGSSTTLRTGLHGLYQSPEPVRGLAFSKGPLYPALLSLWYGGQAGPGSFLVAQSILGALNCLLLFFLARLYLNRNAAAAAGFWMAVQPILILYDTSLLRETLAITFLLLWAMAATRGYRNRSFGSIFLAGLAAGLASITRESLLLVVILNVPWLLAVEWSSHWIRRTNFRVLMALCFLAGALVAIGPVTLLNFLESGQVVLISTNGGINFHTGNNPQADGTTAILPGIRWDRARRTEAIGGNRSSWFWWMDGLTFIADNPVQSMKLLVRKGLYFISSREFPNNLDFLKAARDSLILRLPVPGFGTAFALAAAGLLVLGRELISDCFPLYLVPLSVMLGNLVFFTSSRQRIPALPFLIILAVLSFGFLYRDLRNPDLRRRGILPMVAAILLMALSWQGFFPSSPWTMDRRWVFDLAAAKLRDGNLSAASQGFSRACELMPDDPDSPFGLAMTFHLRNQISQALEKYKQTLLLAQDHTSALNNCGNIMLASGEFDQAMAFFRKAFSFTPWDGNLLFNMAVCQERMGDLASASATYGRAWKLGADRAALLNNLAGLNLQIASRSGKKNLNAEAVNMARRAVAMRPEEPRLWHTLGRALLAVRDFEQAGLWLTRAYDELSFNPEVQVDMGRWLFVTGRFSRARTIFASICEKWPGTTQALQAETLKKKLDQLGQGQ